MNRFLLIATLLAACQPDTTIVAQKRVLTTDLNTFDAGTVAVNDRETLTVYLASTGDAPVTVFNVYLEDATDTHWVVLPTWDNTTAEVDGVEVDTLEIDDGSEDNPTYAPVEVSFRPDVEGYYHATLIIESNDSQVVETNPDTGNKIWRVVLRGVARYPCVTVYPAFYDFGPHPAGGYFGTSTTIENCGTVMATVASYQVDGSASFYADSVFPIYVLPGSYDSLNLAWIPSTGDSETADVNLVTNDPDFSTPISLVGNDCDSSVDTSWDMDGDGWFACGGDCDDEDPDINPQASDGKDDEGDGVDNDCDDQVDEGPGFGADNDGDGITENDGDCWDNDALVYPGANETLNQTDDDCDGIVDETTEWYDDDKDGYSERSGDCDDSDSSVFPGGDEAYDTLDNDCDGHVDEGTYSFDDDEDGYAEVNADGSTADCDDGDPWAFPGGSEDCDTVDNDCDGLIDEGEDDAADGACDFVVERNTVQIVDDNGGCSTAPGRLSGVLGVLAALGLTISRRR